MAGRKGQRSGGHNKKSKEDHLRDGTHQKCREQQERPPNAFASAFADTGGDVSDDIRQLYRIFQKSAKLWEDDPTDKESRLSACAAIDRIVRVTSLLAADNPPEEETSKESDGPSMGDLLALRGSDGQSRQQVERYIAGVMSGEIIAGERVKQAVKRHLFDLEYAYSRGHYFDEQKATAAVMWFPISLRHTKGEWAGDPVYLTDNQAFILWCVYGWRREDGTRRFRHVYISCARKWGKSTIAAGMGLMGLTFDDPLEVGAEVFCFATKEDQARIVHRTAQQMATESPELRRQCKSLANSIVTLDGAYQPHSFFRPLGSDSKTMDGLNVHLAIADEIHEFGKHHRGLWEKLNTASGSRRNWMIVTIMTAGDDRSELWIEIEDLCVATLDRYDEDDPPGDNRFVFIARLDGKRPCECGGLPACGICEGTGEIPEDDPFDEANWPKANPNYPVTPKPDFMREQASDARNNPKALHMFKRYHCNVRVSSVNRAIHDKTWALARGEFSDWESADVICGAWDMGGQDDIAAIGYCARFDTGEREVDEKTGEKTDRPVFRYEVDASGFLNTECERDMTREPWSDWLASGLLKVHPHEINEMRKEIMREWETNHIKSWAYDPHTSRDFAQSLEPEGIECVKFFQNAGMWTEPVTNF